MVFNESVVKTLEEESQDEGCFVKNKKFFFIEESSSAQTILNVSHKCSAGRSCEKMPCSLPRPLAPNPSTEYSAR